MRRNASTSFGATPERCNCSEVVVAKLHTRSGRPLAGIGAAAVLSARMQQIPR